MNWYRVTREDGSYSWVQATSKSEASQKVRNAGELIKLVKEVDESDVPASAKGGTAEPTPTPTPTPTTPTPTTPPAGGTTTTPTTGEYKDWSYLVTFGTRLEQQIEDYNKQNKTSFAFDTAGIKSYLDKIGSIEKTRESILRSYDLYMEAQTSYQAYLDYYPTVGAPAPKDIADYLAHFEEWNVDYGEEAIATKRQREFNTWVRYSQKYGAPDDWYPVDIDDFFDNYEKAQGQLTKWEGMAEEVEAEYTDEQVREFNNFKQYASQYGELTDWFPVDIGDYFANYDQAQQQLGVWQQVAEDVEKYQISPAEALRRQEEGYAEGRYAAKERYGEAPEYQPAFAQWMGGQEQFSGALQQYVEREYPSLKSEFQATQPRLTGFPTREEARAEATKREQAFQAWLPQQIPGREQEYWSQRPAERGERLYMQQPTMRTVNW